jgi:transcriptional regulator with XRE-family HTH domain
MKMNGNFRHRRSIMYSAAVFWETVKKEIKEKNTTQEEIAQKAGVSFNTFHGWISKGVLPRASDAVLIARALNTTVEFLVTGGSQAPGTSTHDINSHIKKIHQELDAIAAAAQG